ncbi:MAG: flagellar protein FlaG [Selenomonadaceae bacterium]|nr:flagellar protein FlaG [Selenomonadaceae bacterium]
MIGKVQDVMAGAIVLGAADKAASSKAVEQEATRQQKTVTETKDIEKLQDEWNNGVEFDGEKPDTPPLDEGSVSTITKELNELMDKINCDISFKYHKDVDMMSVSMVDKKTDEVIKELPPEEMIENIKKAREWIGAFLDKNA